MTTKVKMNVQLPVRQAILDRRTYEPPGEGRADKLRLDFNENTAGCSRAVRRALAKLTPQLLANAEGLQAHSNAIEVRR